MYGLCTLAIIFICSSMVFWDRYFCSDITVLENPFSLSVTLKPSLEPLRTIFPWCPLGLHLCSGQCPFNQEKCLRRCGIEDRNGSLTLTQTASPPPPDELSWQIAAVGIIGLYRWAGNDNVVLCVISRERRQFGWAEGEPFFSFLFYSSIIKPVIKHILDLLFVEKSNTSIKINISLKILFHYR